jgi:hypothetical protein
MSRRLLLFVALVVCRLPAQLSLFVIQSDSASNACVSVQGGSEKPVNPQQGYGFGTVSTGDACNIPFRLRNTGATSTPLTILSLNGTGFSIVSPSPLPQLPTTLDAGAAIDLIISFAPTAPGFYSAVFSADGISTILFGTALSATQVSLDDGSGTLQPLAPDAVINFGGVVRNTTAVRRLKLTNPLSAQISISQMSITGAAFQSKGVPLPIRLDPGASTTIEIDFTPKSNGEQDGSIDIDQRRFGLTGKGIDPSFPKPQIEVNLAQPASSQQGTLKISFAEASQAEGSGEVDVDIHAADPNANADKGILFLASGGPAATFSVKHGDTVAHFGSADSVTFQTGTTAGDLVFTVKLGGFQEQQTLTIPTAAVGVDSTKAQRTSAGLDLVITAFDNTRSVSKLTYTFFDQTGATLPPGAITIDSSASFQQFFSSSDLGGVFSLHGFFPVIGNPNQVDSVEVSILNSAGTAQTGKLQFTTP